MIEIEVGAEPLRCILNSMRTLNDVVFLSMVNHNFIIASISKNQSMCIRFSHEYPSNLSFEWIGMKIDDLLIPKSADSFKFKLNSLNRTVAQNQYHHLLNILQHSISSRNDFNLKIQSLDIYSFLDILKNFDGVLWFEAEPGGFTIRILDHQYDVSIKSKPLNDDMLPQAQWKSPVFRINNLRKFKIHKRVLREFRAHELFVGSLFLALRFSNKHSSVEFILFPEDKL